MNEFAHPGHVEGGTDRQDRSLADFTRVSGVKRSDHDGNSACLRARNGCECHASHLTRRHITRVDPVGGRVRLANCDLRLIRAPDSVSDRGPVVLSEIDHTTGKARGLKGIEGSRMQGSAPVCGSGMSEE